MRYICKGSLEVKLLTIWRDEKQRWETAPCAILVWTHISRCSSPFSWWNLVTSSPPLIFEENALDLEAVWPFGGFFGELWHWVDIKKVLGTQKNQWWVSQKKNDKGFFITASWSLVPKMFEPNCGWFGARFRLPNMGVGIQIVGLGMFSCYEWSLFCW